MSDVTNWIMVGFAAVGVIGSGALAMISVGEHRKTVAYLELARTEDKAEFRRELGAMENRVAAAEAAAGAVQGLASAIESMGEKFSSEMKHLVERVGLETGHIREQLTDLKQEVRTRAPRRSRTVED